MAERFSFGEVNLDVSTGRERTNPALDSETPFLVALLGDFSGRANRGALEVGAKLASRRVLEVDRDNFEQVLAKLAPHIEVPLDSVSLDMRFAELDDFHPDRIFERSAIFQKLRRMRERLADPESFSQVLAELGVHPTAGGATHPAKPEAQPRITSADVQQIASGDLLTRSIDETQGQAAAQRTSGAPDELRAFVQRIVQPHLVARADPRQAELTTVLDRATSDQMRALLHVPDFQALESAWRALWFLVRRVETGERLKLYLLDVSKAELAADLAAAQDLRSTGAYRLLVEQSVGTPGAQRWAVIAGNYTFEPAREDAELLGRLAKVARAAGAPLLAAASPGVLGCNSVAELTEPREWQALTDTESAEAWDALRRLPEAPYVGLALPRFLLRLPYGKDTDRTELFEFEELSSTAAHEDYLWGNPAIALTLLLTEAFSREGWKMRASALEVDGLPLHTYRENGESLVKPCAEALLTQDAAEEILDRGLMPLISFKGRDSVRLLRFQSIADPLKALAGRWA